MTDARRRPCWRARLLTLDREVAGEVTGRPESVAVLRSPNEVARWIDTQIRAHATRHRVQALAEHATIHCADADDRVWLWRAHVATAAQGNILRTTIHGERASYEIIVEPVGDAKLG